MHTSPLALEVAQLILSIPVRNIHPEYITGISTTYNRNLHTLILETVVYLICTLLCIHLNESIDIKQHFARVAGTTFPSYWNRQNVQGMVWIEDVYTTKLEY